MNYKSIILVVLIMSQFFSFKIKANGNTTRFEMGTAMYRTLSTLNLINNHWHTGVFTYFEVINSSCYMNYVQSMGSFYDPIFDWGGVQESFVGRSISPSNYTNDLGLLKTDLISNFSDGWVYHGSYSIDMLPTTRANIAVTAETMAHADIRYTFEMILQDAPGWDGTVNDIYKSRCDGVVEFSYEKNGVIVCNVYDSDCSTPSSTMRNISTNDVDALSYHNNLHNAWEYACGELCPRIQAGEVHSNSQAGISNMSSLGSTDPIISDFSNYVYAYSPDLCFKISDDASVKAYILLEVKKSSESVWHTLIDGNGSWWEFKEVDLTDYSSGLQHDYINVHWSGQYVGGQYPIQQGDYDLRITVIDQGANPSSSTFSFSDTQTPPPSISMTRVYGSAPVLSFSGGFPNVDHYVLRKEYNFGSGYGTPGYVNPANSPYTDNNVFITKFGDLDARYSVQAIRIGGQESLYSDYVSTYGQSTWKISNDTKTEEIIKKYALESNYPNPFNPSTTITYQLPKDGFVKLAVYNSLGQEVAKLVSKNQTVGKYSVQFDASNLPSGIYIYKFQAGEFGSVKKMMLTK